MRMTILCGMAHSKTLPEHLPMFRGLVLYAKAIGGGFITEAQYRLLEREFIVAQDRPGSPAFLWGWGHQRLLRDALTDAGVSVKRPETASLHPFVLNREGFSRLSELEIKMKNRNVSQD